MKTAGKYRHKVQVQSRSTALGTRGQSTEAWSDVGDKRWAGVTHLAGKELEQARQVVATATTLIELRKPRSFELTTKHRLVFKDENYNIGSVTPTGDDHQDVDCLCTRVV